MPAGDRTDLAVLEKVRRLTVEGRCIKECAAIMGCTPRQVSRYRAILQIQQTPVPFPWNQQLWFLAQNLLEDRCPYTEVARTVGATTSQVRSAFPNYGIMGNPLGNGIHPSLAERLGLGLGNSHIDAALGVRPRINREKPGV
jgi:hypothetical protein